MKKLFSLLIILPLITSYSSPVFAANGTWLNTGGSDSWGDSTNWVSGTIPGSTSLTTNADIATFNTSLGNYGTSTTPIVIDSGRNIGGITFDTSSAGGYYIGSTSGNSLLLTSGGTIQSTSTVASFELINAPLILEGNGTYTFSSNSTVAADTLNFNGGITAGASGATTLALAGTNTGDNIINGAIGNGSGTLSVTQSGTGIWVLSGDNSYTGTTTINAGTLRAVNTNALGATSAPLVLNGGTLDLAFNSGIASYNTTVTSSSAITSGLETVGAGITYTLGTLSIGADTLTINKGVNDTSGTAGLTFGATTLTASGAAFTANSGTLLTLGSISDGGSGYSFTVNGAGNTDITGVIGTGESVTQSGTGTLTLSGDNTYTGNTTVSSGILNIQNDNALGSGAGTTSVASGATLQIQGGITTAAEALTLNGTGVSGNGALENVSGNNTYAGLITLGSNTLINSDTSATTLTLSNAGTITGSGDDLTIGGAGNTTINSIIGTGAGTLTKNGAGTLTLTGANTYTGVTTLNGGEVDLGVAEIAGTSGPLGDSAASNPGSIILNGGYLQYSASNQFDYSGRFSTAASQQYNVDTNSEDVTWGTALTSSGGSLTKIGAGTLILTGANTYSGTTTISGGTLQIGNAGTSGTLGTGSVTDNASLTFDRTDDPTVSNVISGTGSVGQIGSGILTLSGPNTYSGATTIASGGTIEAGVASVTGVSGAFGLNSALTVAGGGTLDLAGFNESIGSLAGAGLVTSSAAGTPTLTVGGNNTSTAFSGIIQDGSAASVGLTKDGSGILTLSGPNTYSGVTTLNDGEINLGVADIPGTSGPLGDSAASDPGSIVLNGGYLQYSASNQNDYSGRFSTAADQQYNVDTNSENVTWATALTSSGGSLTKTGAGILSLDAANSYSGATTINNGTLQTEVSGALPAASDVTVGGSGILDLDGHSAAIGSLAGSGTVTSTAGGVMTLTAGDTLSTTFSGTIQDGSGTGSGTIALTTAGSGSLILGSGNAYSGGTTIASGSTLQAENAGALGSGDVTNAGTLSLGTTNLSLGAGSTYTQSAGSALGLTVNSASSFGSITSTVAASVASGSAINVTLGGGYITSNQTFDVINTAGAGVTGGGAPAIDTTNSAVVTFSSSTSSGNLVLTSSSTGFSRFADNANARSIANVLDGIQNPSNSDMSSVLFNLETASTSKIASSLNTMGPAVDGGVVLNSAAALNNLVTATLDRMQNNLNHIAAPADNTDDSGLSSGDETAQEALWAKPFGSYLMQGTLAGIQGYDAWNAGTAIGLDRMITDAFTVGVSGGYAYGQVSSDANDATTDINSAEGTVYAGYKSPDLNYFIDAAGSFAWNWYDGRRDINVGALNRTADASYNGQQFGTYLDGGYKFNFGGNFYFTPLASLQWEHLTLDKYTETNANALDLNVNAQNYNTLESGLGASFSFPQQLSWGNFTPEFHAKWLYDFVDDDMSVTSSFVGGGASFTSNGAAPSREGADIGGKLTYDFSNNLSLIAAFDTELRDKFFGVYGSGTLRYKF